MESQIQGQNSKNQETPVRVKRDLAWLKILFLLHLYLGSLYGIYLVLFEAKIITSLFALLLTLLSVWGTTVGSHRLWAHQCFEATGVTRVFLMLLQTLVGNGSIYNWVLDHRVHHKYFGTDNDPYNHEKGFLYSFIYCHFLQERPIDIENQKTIDMTDIKKDGVVMFQKRIYWVMMPILSLLLPINAPFEYMGESLLCSAYVVGILRFTLSLHMAWLINVSTIVWGEKPGERISDSNLIFFITKSKWPFYHYLLPWDYKTGEYGRYDEDCSTALIRVLAALRLVSNLRTIDSNQVHKCLERSATEDIPIIQLLNEEGKIKRDCDSILEKTF